MTDKNISFEELLGWSLDNLMEALNNSKYEKIHFKIVIILFILEQKLKKIPREPLKYDRLNDTEKELIKSKYPSEHDEMVKQIEENINKQIFEQIVKEVKESKQIANKNHDIEPGNKQ